jgi:prepilin-type processing-associated H-X9-DG protein
LQDKAGYENQNIWGGPHSTGIHMAFCDGSVHNINYTIDATTHANLANRNATVAIDPTKVQ